MKYRVRFLLGLMALHISGCSGLKVVQPTHEPEQLETKILDMSTGTPRLVSAHKCWLSSMGDQFSALAKTEEEARKEVLAKCRDHSVISNCDSSVIICNKN